MRALRRAAIVLVLGLAACGRDASPLEQTQANMAKLKSGDIDLRLAARAGSGDTLTAPAGFRMAGPFSLAPTHRLAVFALTYTQLLGDRTRTTKVTSTGSAAFVDTGSKTYRVRDKDLGTLRLADNPSGGISDLGIAGWVEDAKTTRAGATQTITGTVDAADMLSDLARVAGSVGADAGLGALDSDAAARLQKLVKSSSIKVVTGARNHELRTLHAVVDFGTRAPADLKRTLGRYARARIEVDLSMKQLTSELHVAAPRNFVTL
jgi:hypothetical protein